MKVSKLICALVFAIAASSAFAVGPAPGAVNLETGEVTAYVQTPWSVANYGLMPKPKKIAGFTSQPWAVERSAFYKGDLTVAGAEDSGESRGRL
jgi:hypothetical protein